MADGEDNTEVGEAQHGTEKADETGQKDLAKPGAKKGEDSQQNGGTGGFISTTDSMKNAARTKVDTIISQVRLAVKEDVNVEKSEKSEEKMEGKASITEEKIELKFVDALCDSVSLPKYKIHYVRL